MKCFSGSVSVCIFDTVGTVLDMSHSLTDIISRKRIE